ncbi:hypothetical protein [Qingshengfaniella alkalisoli]|uniref:ATPase AAA-type core domain-containing protein n=1 Tax=Qingshengfaniella alkalisoli TaxID=2599296 RepID=A0A5B8IZ61_9RHOB|nr:hypothetical protein [Qingshengfaniella alkalisoli]QDY71422.1 hypothetical protein FPZ52_17215 [Qingshengfaniella alkalisoli]
MDGAGDRSPLEGNAPIRTSGERGFRLPPVLLNGPPGIGKSMWAREVNRHIGIPRCGIEGIAE